MRRSTHLQQEIKVRELRHYTTSLTAGTIPAMRTIKETLSQPTAQPRAGKLPNPGLEWARSCWASCQATFPWPSSSSHLPQRQSPTHRMGGSEICCFQRFSPTSQPEMPSQKEMSFSQSQSYLPAFWSSTSFTCTHHCIQFWRFEFSTTDFQCSLKQHLS